MAEKFVTLSTLQYYDGKLKAWVGTELDEAIAGLGNVFTLKGSKTTIGELPTTDNKQGDIYIVGTSAPFDEYYWDGTQWELMGTTATDISGVVTKEALYEGADGTGTVVAPADGSIIKSIYDKIATAQAAADKAQGEVDALETLVGTIPEGATATTVVGYAKELADAIEEYDDTEVRGLIRTNTEAIAAINNADTGILAQAKAYAGEIPEGATATTVADYAKELVDANTTKIDALEEAINSQVNNSDIDDLFAGM